MFLPSRLGCSVRSVRVGWIRFVNKNRQFSNLRVRSPYSCTRGPALQHQLWALYQSVGVRQEARDDLGDHDRRIKAHAGVQYETVLLLSPLSTDPG